MILTEEQLEELSSTHKEWLKTVEATFDEELDRRSQVSKKMNELLEEVGLFRGGTFNAEQLCRSIKIQKEVQNLSSIVLPRFLGYLNYSKYFKDFEGSTEDFKKEHPELQKPGNTGLGHPGVDLNEFSEALRNLLTSQGNDFAQSAESVLSFNGVGRAVFSGYLYLFDPDKFPLVNSAAIGGIEGIISISNGQKRNAADLGKEFLKISQKTIPKIPKYISWFYIFKEIKEQLKCNNFHELDWFCWKTHSERRPAPSRTRYWKIAPGRNAEYWDTCREGGYIAVGWSAMGDISGLSRPEFIQRKNDAAPKEGWKGTGVNQLWTFSKIKEGDRIIANHGTTKALAIGTVTGPYYFVQGESFSHRIPVKWDDVNPRKIQKSGWRRTICEMTQLDFEAIENLPPLFKVKPLASSAHESAPVDYQLNPEYPLAECASETGFAENLLARWVRAIERKKQAIIYGPPGTGKTYLAEHLAKHLIGSGDGFAELVQFHPAYAYEDFIQGIRPQARGDGILDYPGVPRRSLEFCKHAKKRADRCVLIIDEINRANLARVFGELMYLLEYRNQTVPLASGGFFRIPDNVRMIGTMNTADRSIALVDHALRRRFAFLALYPNYHVLKQYHENTSFNVQPLIQTMEKLNTQIADRHYEVGITYFLREDLSDQIEDIWRMEIEPYLEEYFFDQQDKAEAFRWENIEKDILP